ncbi:hypothetical protein ONS95_003441 [Cadophora gregata]|uniref:uncharacterized protein n=1 Tax=Cadophora gregata TaxID=51156 RepID=UPI0026DB1AB9|nr:uncharacterized protein ONS95_003441 [Cadophora gregata]KAK0108648.1 hypothetical protein ONS95_003441 [Cadophora gregata]KAK0108761.1 hypothetical protein ONS96_002606 [Cadophora gregata f. sp. sojae]
MVQSNFPSPMHYQSPYMPQAEETTLGTISPTAMMPSSYAYSDFVASAPTNNLDKFSGTRAIPDDFEYLAGSNTAQIPFSPTSSFGSTISPGTVPELAYPTVPTQPAKRKRGRPRKDPNDTTKAPYKHRKPRNNNEPAAKNAKFITKAKMLETIARITGENEDWRMKYEKEVKRSSDLEVEIQELKSRLLTVAPPNDVDETNAWGDIGDYDFDVTFELN